LGIVEQGHEDIEGFGANRRLPVANLGLDSQEARTEISSSAHKTKTAGTEAGRFDWHL
jgi:hypothetical protein